MTRERGESAKHASDQPVAVLRPRGPRIRRHASVHFFVEVRVRVRRRQVLAQREKGDHARLVLWLSTLLSARPTAQMVAMVGSSTSAFWDRDDSSVCVDAEKVTVTLKWSMTVVSKGGHGMK